MSSVTAIDQAEATVNLLGGLVLHDGHRLDQVGLRRLSGREEDWLSRHGGVSIAEAITEVLAACLTLDEAGLTTRQIAQGLLVGDRDFMMIQLRRLTLGDQIAAVYTCPACASKMDVSLDLSDVPVEFSLQTQSIYELELSGDRCVRFRLPNGADQESVAAIPVEEAVDALLHRCVIESGDAPLNDDDRQQIADEMERIAPKVEIELDLICPECGHQFLVEFDVAAFFFTELAASQKTLLREVHHLAFHYGWSEAAILAMDRGRRRAYLSLLADELRQE
jgi:hypothetical protein